MPPMAHSRAMSLSQAVSPRAARDAATRAAALAARGRRRHRDRGLPRLARPVRARLRRCHHRGTAGLALLLAAHHGPAVRRHVPRGEPAVRRPGDPGQGWAFTAALGSRPGAGVGASPPSSRTPLGVAHHRARCTRPSWATCWPASASSWSSGTGSSLGGFNVVALLCQERWAGGPATCRWDSTSGSSLAFAAVSDLAAGPGLRGGRGPAQPRHRDEPPSRALHRRLSAPRPDRDARDGDRFTVEACAATSDR